MDEPQDLPGREPSHVSGDGAAGLDPGNLYTLADLDDPIRLARDYRDRAEQIYELLAEVTVWLTDVHDPDQCTEPSCPLTCELSVWWAGLTEIDSQLAHDLPPATREAAKIHAQQGGTPTMQTVRASIVAVLENKARSWHDLANEAIRHELLGEES